MLDESNIDDVVASDLHLVDDQLSDFFDATFDLQNDFEAHHSKFEAFLQIWIKSSGLHSIHHLRGTVILFSFGCYFQYHYFDTIVKPFFAHFSRLAKPLLDILWKALLHLPHFLHRLVSVLETILTLICLDTPHCVVYKDGNGLNYILNFLRKLWEINQFQVPKLPSKEFGNDALSLCLSPELEARRALEPLSNRTTPFGLFFDEYGCLFNLAFKSKVRKLQARLSSEEPLQMRVRRSHIVEDTIQWLNQVRPQQLGNRLRIQFQQEEAIDAGGVSRDYFYNIATAIFSPDYAIFQEVNHVYWFSHCKFTEPIKARLLGDLVGLAVNNGIVLPIRFPLLLYKKLKKVLNLRLPESLDSLAEIEPETAESFRWLLTNQRESVADFGLTFSRDIEGLGSIDTYDLIENGHNVLVTSENVEKYVEAYINWTLVTSVHLFYDAFETGFNRVCHLPIYQRFTPDELDVLVSGVDIINWDELRFAVTYGGGYTAESESIEMFWDVFDSLNIDQKKNLLVFATGTAKVPIGGLSKLKLRIVKTQDMQHLPVAHTCNATLELPDYQNLEVIRRNIRICLEHTVGFGLK
jgi:hypothetical protein